MSGQEVGALIPFMGRPGSKQWDQKYGSKRVSEWKEPPCGHHNKQKAC